MITLWVLKSLADVFCIAVWNFMRNPFAILRLWIANVGMINLWGLKALAHVFCNAEMIAVWNFMRIAFAILRRYTNDQYYIGT